MDIQGVIAIAERIHDAEGWTLGDGTTREHRNAFWSRVIGCVHHGHPTYNPSPDPQWHCKSAGGGRPQSDDVAVSLPSRRFWDCIPGSGADGYRFATSGAGEILPPEQEIIVPPVPDGGGVPIGGGTGPSSWTDAHQTVLRLFAEAFPPRAVAGDDDWTRRLVEQLRATFPEDGFCGKAQSSTHPLSNNVIGRLLAGRLTGYKVLPVPATAPAELDISNQFARTDISAVDHLGLGVHGVPGDGGGTPGDDPRPVGDCECPATVAAELSALRATVDAIGDALARLAAYLTTEIAALKARQYVVDGQAPILGHVTATIRPKDDGADVQRMDVSAAEPEYDGGVRPVGDQ
ncbi:MAG: hypothetical protein AB7O32_00540 [Vicinamibacterales bacterium]